MRLKATGTNPVNLELQVDALTPLTYADSDVLRKTLGTPGFGGYSADGIASEHRN